MVNLIIEKKYFGILVGFIFVYVFLGVAISLENYVHDPSDIYIQFGSNEISLSSAINTGKFNGNNGQNQEGFQCRFCKSSCSSQGDYPNTAGYIGHRSSAWGGGTCNDNSGLDDDNTNGAWLCCK